MFVGPGLRELPDLAGANLLVVPVFSVRHARVLGAQRERARPRDRLSGMSSLQHGDVKWRSVTLHSVPPSIYSAAFLTSAS